MVLKSIVVSLGVTLLLTHTEFATARRPISSQTYDEDDDDDMDDYQDTGDYEDQANQYSRASQERAERR